MKRLAAALGLVVALLGACAHVPPSAKACAERLTQDLTESAAAALARDDYEPALTRSFAGVAACLVTAAVEEAIHQARISKYAGARTEDVASAIELHGEAWLTRHRPG